MSNSTTDTLEQSSAPETLAADLDRLGGRLADVKAHIGEIIYGQDEVIEQSLIALLSGGHALLVGVPGLGKTLLVQTLATVLGLDDKRIQFTPDLMPADIVGSEVLEEGEGGARSFRFIKGPVFCQMLMADEINRASPRTQSALLQAMQEHTISVAGEIHKLPKPFHVVATQNPIEQEGTYPLPEAQLDRFLIQINVTYPDHKSEKMVLAKTTGAENQVARKVLNAKELLAAQKLVRHVPVGDAVVEAILKLVRAGRPEETDLPDVAANVSWGPGPRASQAFMLCARARAVMQGRLAPSVDDVIAIAEPVLRHRMALNFAARADGVNISDIIRKLCAVVA